MNNYICLVTKIKAMSKNLLTDNDWRQLSRLNSLNELVEFFKPSILYGGLCKYESFHCSPFRNRKTTVSIF